jgi:pantetheine-phosphate adenylyltransferase
MTKGKDVQRLAVYPGTFDPIHNGHIDVVRRSVQLFDEVIVAVAHNPDKDNALFGPDERVDMIREAIHDLEPKARVDKFSGLSVDYAERIGAKVIIRSLRAVTDFGDEQADAAQRRDGVPVRQSEAVFQRLAPDQGSRELRSASSRAGARVRDESAAAQAQGGLSASSTASSFREKVSTEFRAR